MCIRDSSIAVDGEEQSRNRPGVNVLVYDKVLDSVIPVSYTHLNPNSRFTAPAANCPCLSKEFNNPNGVPVTAMVFGLSLIHI